MSTNAAPIKFSASMAPGDPFWASRTITAFKAKSGASENRYEAAVPSIKRSYLPAFVRDARFDADSWSRYEITRKVRYFDRNTWIVPAQKATHIKYTVGANGLQVIPNSSDHEWNKAAADDYARWCEEPFVDSSINMAKGDQLMAGADFLEAEVFFLETFAKQDGKKSEPRLQLIESHRCASPGYDGTGGRFEDNKNLVDGVQVDDFGKEAGYWIRDNFAADGYSFKPASRVIHVADFDRIGMKRPISRYAPVLNTLHDMDDLTLMEMERAKDNSSTAKFLTTWDGELNPEEFRRNPGAPVNPEAEKLNAEELNKRLHQYRQVLGSRTFSLKPGEKFEQLVNANPSAATQWYWRFLISQIFAARDQPLYLSLPESIQGTVARGVLDDADIAFMAHFCRYAAASRRKYRFYMQWARYNRPALYDAPADWEKCHVVRPRACNVDVGRNTTAELASIAAGTKSYDDVAAPDGTTADERFYKKAVNVARAKQIAAAVSKEYKVPVSGAEVIGNVAEIAALLAKAEATAKAATATEDDADPKTTEPAPTE